MVFSVENLTFFSKNLSNLCQSRNFNLIYLVNKRVSFVQEYDHFLTCPDPSGMFYQANYHADKVGLWGYLRVTKVSKKGRFLKFIVDILCVPHKNVM